MKMMAVAVLASLVSIVSQASTNFTCTISAIPQHDSFKSIYTVHGDQNPLKVTYDFQGPTQQVHYFQIDTFGRIVKGLVSSNDPETYFLRVKFTRVSPPAELELPNGVRIELNTPGRDTYAGLGMRDDYTTYVQDVTGELEDGRKVLMVLACSR